MHGVSIGLTTDGFARTTEFASAGGTSCPQQPLGGAQATRVSQLT